MYYPPGSILYLFIVIALMRKEASARMEIRGADGWISWDVLFGKWPKQDVFILLFPNRC
jgi:hypothetical protein